MVVSYYTCENLLFLDIRTRFEAFLYLGQTCPSLNKIQHRFILQCIAFLLFYIYPFSIQILNMVWTLYNAYRPWRRKALYKPQNWMPLVGGYLILNTDSRKALIGWLKYSANLFLILLVMNCLVSSISTLETPLLNARFKPIYISM